MQRFFRVTAPSSHRMITELDTKGLVTRTPGMARSVQVVISPQELPVLTPPAQPIRSLWATTSTSSSTGEDLDPRHTSSACAPRRIRALDRLPPLSGKPVPSYIFASRSAPEKMYTAPLSEPFQVAP